MQETLFIIHVFRRLCEGFTGLSLMLVLRATASARPNLTRGPRLIVWGLALALLAFGLSGCSSPVRVLCPSLVTYSATDQTTLRGELASAPLPMTHRFMRDYGGLRDQVRACQGSK